MLTIRHRAAVDVTQAVRERLGRVRREHGVDLAERLLLIGRDCAAHLKEPFRTIDIASGSSRRMAIMAEVSIIISVAGSHRRASLLTAVVLLPALNL